MAHLRRPSRRPWRSSRRWASDPELRERLGAVAFQTDNAPGTQDGLQFYNDGNKREFLNWCRKAGGKVVFESGETVMPKTAGFLWPAPASMEDASWVCKASDESTIAAVLRGAPRVTQVKYWGGGMIPAYEFRYAFFDGPSWVDLPARRDAAFAAQNAAAEEARSALKRYEREKAEKLAAETARLRAEPKVGDETSLGLIVEVKPPLVLVQIRADRRQARNASQEWVKIDTLRAPR